MILSDPPALVWAVGDCKKLSRAAASAIRRARASGGIAVSAITVWEIASLLARGKVRAYGTLESSIQMFVEGVAPSLLKSARSAHSFRMTIHPIPPTELSAALPEPRASRSSPMTREFGEAPA